MPDYIFKTYILGGREYFVYGERYAPFEQTNVVKEKDFPFLESLLELLYLDIWKYEPLFKDMERVIREIYREDDYSYQARLSGLLDELAQVHIFFQQTRLDWKYRLRQSYIGFLYRGLSAVRPGRHSWLEVIVS